MGRDVGDESATASRDDRPEKPSSDTRQMVVKFRTRLYIAGLVVAFAILATHPARSLAASFDCRKAAKPDEIAVCASPELSDLDTLAAAAYVQAKKSVDAQDSSNVLADARAFLARRGRCASDIACLRSSYVGVLQEMQTYGSTISVPSFISALGLTAMVPPESQALPTHEGDCVQTRITDIGGRLEGDHSFESGTSVFFANKGGQVDYDKVPGIIHSRRGDHVLMCLTSIPKHCPPGDDRGRMYVTTNLRTHETWSDPDSQHMCGGA